MIEVNQVVAGFDPAGLLSLAAWIQVLDLHLQYLGQHPQFHIRNTPHLSFNLRQRGPGQFESRYGAFGGEYLLRHPLLVAEFPDLRSDDVLLVRCHAPVSELDGIGKWA